MFPPTLANVGAGNGVPALLEFNLQRWRTADCALIEINRVVMRAVKILIRLPAPARLGYDDADTPVASAFTSSQRLLRIITPPVQLANASSRGWRCGLHGARVGEGFIQPAFDIFFVTPNVLKPSGMPTRLLSVRIALIASDAASSDIPALSHAHRLCDAGKTRDGVPDGCKKFSTIGSGIALRAPCGGLWVAPGWCASA